MIDFKLSLDGLRKGEKLSRDQVRRVLMRSMFKMEELAIQKAPFDKGALRLGISLFPQILADEYVLHSKADYSADLEYGNTPREVKLDVLADWAERKGITSGYETIGFVLYVQKKIREHGVNAQPYMRPALFEVETFWAPKFIEEEFSIKT